MLRYFAISWKIFVHFDFDGNSTSQKSWNRGNKRLKVIGTNEKQMEEHLTANYVHWQQVSNMTGYKRNISESFCKDVKMGRGLPI